MNLLIALIGLWFFFSGLMFFIEDWRFIRLLKKSNVPVSSFWSGMIFYVDIVYARSRKLDRERIDKNITKKRVKIRRYIQKNFLFSTVFFILIVCVFIVYENIL